MRASLELQLMIDRAKSEFKAREERAISSDKIVKVALEAYLSGARIPPALVPLTEQSHPERMNQDRENPVISSLRQTLMAAKAAIETALGKLDEQTEHDSTLANQRGALQRAARFKESGEGVGGGVNATPASGGRAK